MAAKPSPVDNPLKGLVPYSSQGGRERFPHSMIFSYFSVAEVWVTSDQFDWSPVEVFLEKARSEGRQGVLRFWLEYPGKESGVPKHLREAGVRVTEWKHGTKVIFTPDYESEVLKAGLQKFIKNFGEKYDNDARLGYVTAGLLGQWGEWHGWPRSDLYASAAVEKLVLEAFAKSFKKTPVALRYPAREGHGSHADNAAFENFGYHDDSFGWATLHTGKKDQGWFFETLLKAAGAEDRWKTQPIGGEVRPEIWGTVFTDQPHAKEQDFETCVERVKLSWAMDSGLFAKRFALSETRRARAEKAVRKMGYDLRVRRWRFRSGKLVLEVGNDGVAPFYREWMVVGEFGGESVALDWDVTEVMPGEVVTWEVAVPEKAKQFRFRVPNVMKGGRPLRFGNKDDVEGWVAISLGE